MVFLERAFFNRGIPPQPINPIIKIPHLPFTPVFNGFPDFFPASLILILILILNLILNLIFPGVQMGSAAGISKIEKGFIVKNASSRGFWREFVLRGVKNAMYSWIQSSLRLQVNFHINALLESFTSGIYHFAQGTPIGDRQAMFPKQGIESGIRL